MSSSIDRPSITCFTRQSFQSIQRTHEDKINIEVDNLSLSISSDLLDTTQAELEKNRSSSLLFNLTDVNVDREPIEDANSSVKSNEDDDKQKLLVDSDDEDDGLFNDYNNRTDRHFTSTEIALALSLLKSCHSLTNACISNICKLLKLLHVPNCPTNFRHVRTLTCKPYEGTIFARRSLVSCPSCHKISSSSTHCTSSTTCLSKETFITNPTINHILHIEPQLRAILERAELLKSGDDENIISDISDSPFYRKLLHIETDPFVTLLTNSDGAVVKSISRSIWITSFVINELSPRIRFNREN